MARESEDFREQLAQLAEMYPGAAAITMPEVSKLLAIERRRLLADKTFPAKLVGGRYMIPIIGLARWMTK